MNCPLPQDMVSEIVSTLSTLSTGDISQAKSVLLTLHFLFPHELLPALDLLDRKLVNRLKVTREISKEPQNEVFYVQSASATTSRQSRHHTTKIASYEVRLSAWNCTCPAFAYSAFGKPFQAALELRDESRISQIPGHRVGHNGKARLGGVLTQADAGVPICKHILAAYLGTTAPQLFVDGLYLEEVSKAEAAGRAGG